MVHYAVAYDTRIGRAGVVETHASRSAASARYDDARGSRVGYVECGSFREAVTRAGMMERDEPGAWGPLDVEPADSRPMEV